MKLVCGVYRAVALRMNGEVVWSLLSNRDYDVLLYYFIWAMGLETEDE
jgi:hypothetical protein